MNKVIIITGPTAVGKTKCSLAVAQKLGTDIINGDAYQIYKRMDIGTAKPTKEELATVKHHMMDFLDPLKPFSAADYQREVRGLIKKMTDENKIPLIVGGTGFYLESVIRNYEFTAPRRNEEFLSKFDNYTNEELHNYLEQINPEAAKNVHMNNRKRVLRQREISVAPKHNSNKKSELLYDALVIFLNDDRETLYNRINSRVDEMIKDGLVEEAKSFYPDGLGLTSKAAIGYKELFEYFDGKVSLEEAIENIKLNSRHYAKRQMTWFRNKDNVTNVMIDANNFDSTIKTVLEIIEDFLNK